MDYKTSGVDVEAGRAFVKRIRSTVQSTFRSEVLGGLGGFGGLIRLPSGLEKPVLVAGTDGVGTKLELAQAHESHFSVGVDLVAMCVNDVITSGAEPLFFLDYMATGVLSQEAMSEVVEGIADGCRMSNCSLLGGETAEMPGFYPPGGYDLAGFCVAVVDETLLIDGKKIADGDQIVGVASSGVHSNGFSLVRKVLSISEANSATRFGSDDRFLIEALLTPTTLYTKLVKEMLSYQIPIRGMAHITGGGLPENLPRCLPKGVKASVDQSTWTRPEIFQWLKDVGKIPERDLWHTFNLGVGFCVVVQKEAVEEVLEICSEQGFDAWIMGEIKEKSDCAEQACEGIPL